MATVKEGPGSARPGDSAGHANVLIVDDQRILLLALASCLRNCLRDCSILSAENGEEAVAVLRSQPVDLVLTDIRMPVMDGFELSNYIRTNHPAIPVFVMSSDLDFTIEERLRRMGVRYCIEKPFTLHELGVRIAEELNLPDRERRPEPAFMS